MATFLDCLWNCSHLWEIFLYTVILCFHVKLWAWVGVFSNVIKFRGRPLHRGNIMTLLWQQTKTSKLPPKFALLESIGIACTKVCSVLKLFGLLLSSTGKSILSLQAMWLIFRKGKVHFLTSKTDNLLIWDAIVLHSWTQRVYCH